LKAVKKSGWLERALMLQPTGPPGMAAPHGAPLAENAESERQPAAGWRSDAISLFREF